MRTVTFGFFWSMTLSRRTLVGERAVAARERPEVKLAHVAEHGQLHVLDRPVVVVEEIEAAHLVGAVVRAIPRADAAVVGHDVEALVVVDGGVDRADRLARRVLALLAGHRLEEHLRVLEILRVLRIAAGHVGGEIAVDADPVHLAAAHDLVLADDGDVVLRLAGDRCRCCSRRRC